MTAKLYAMTCGRLVGRLKDMIEGAYDVEDSQLQLKAAQEQARYESMSEKQFAREIRQLEKRMLEHASNLDDPVLLNVEFALDADSPDAILKRMRKAWIQRKAAQPFSFQASARMFKNPRGLSAAALVDQAGLVRTRVGGAEVSDRDADYVVVHSGASSRDVLRLIELVGSRVRERFGVELECEITVW